MIMATKNYTICHIPSNLFSLFDRIYREHFYSNVSDRNIITSFMMVTMTVNRYLSMITLKVTLTCEFSLNSVSGTDSDIL